ncbi:hypothetical protein GIB67_032184 [Kingdonia uniflora]|uniref:Uncharacterized protein n=1 Tax=Kingdonia uniflora TaxID=39325 RepID=A0A7J7MX07_9MAGN|nr:hypothetical protein GIB67_032184 [Kingdonia uniflora]
MFEFDSIIIGKKSVESFKGISEVVRRYSPTATGNSSYLALVTTSGLAKHAGTFWDGPDFGVLSWDNKLTGAQELLADIAAKICLSQIHELVEYPNAEFQSNPFFTEQLTAFEVWLDHGSEHKKPPEQLPILLQVWCDNGYPRLVQRPLEIALTRKMTRRCACFTEEELNQPGLEVYNGCDHLAKVCPV